MKGHIMDFFTVIKERRSIRRYKDTPVPEEIIESLIESARLAPSGGNGQGWLFGIITDPVIIKQLAEAAGNQKWITTAPLVIALCGNLEEELKSLPEDDFSLIVNRGRFTPEFIDYLRDYPDQRAVSLLFSNSVPMIPGEHIFLTAVNYGLSACWVGFLDIKRASGILNLPDEDACFYLMPIGYKAEEPVYIERKTIHDIAFVNSYEYKYDSIKEQGI
jgi:nitroreductase